MPSFPEKSSDKLTSLSSERLTVVMERKSRAQLIEAIKALDIEKACKWLYERPELFMIDLDENLIDSTLLTFIDRHLIETEQFCSNYKAIEFIRGIFSCLIEQNDPVLLRHLLNYKFRHKYTALHIAAGTVHDSMLELLIEHGADVGAKTASGDLPIHCALSYDGRLSGFASHIRVQEILSKQEFDINSGNQQGETPLQLAISRRAPISIIKTLLGRGANLFAVNSNGKTPLQYAAHMGNVELMQLIISRLSIENLNVREIINTPDSNNKNLLHYALEGGQVELACYLLSQGADLYRVRNYLETSPSKNEAQEYDEAIECLTLIFIKSIKDGDEQTVKDFLKQARRWLYRPLDSKGVRAIHIAAMYGQDNILKIILTEMSYIPHDDEGKKLKLDMRSSRNLTALFYAVENKRQSTIKLLLENGADINARGGDDSQPLLHFSLQTPDEDIVALLIKNGADLTIKDGNGLMPSEIVISRNNYFFNKCKELREAILQTASTDKKKAEKALAKVDAMIKENKTWLEAPLDAQGNTVLHYAVSANNSSAIKLISDHVPVRVERPKLKAIKSIVNKQGFSPLDIAAVHSDVALRVNPLLDTKVNKADLATMQQEALAKITDFDKLYNFILLKPQALTLCLQQERIRNLVIEGNIVKNICMLGEKNREAMLSAFSLFTNVTISVHVFPKLALAFPEAVDKLWKLVGEFDKRTFLAYRECLHSLLSARPDMFTAVWNAAFPGVKQNKAVLLQVIFNSPPALLHNQEARAILENALSKTQETFGYKIAMKIFGENNWLGKKIKQKLAESYSMAFDNVKFVEDKQLALFVQGQIYLNGFFAHERNVKKALELFREAFYKNETSVLAISIGMQIANIYLADDFNRELGEYYLEVVIALVNSKLDDATISMLDIKQLKHLKAEADELLELMSYRSNKIIMPAYDIYTTDARAGQVAKNKPANWHVVTALDNIHELSYQIKACYDARETRYKQASFFRQQKCISLNKPLEQLMQIIEKIKNIQLQQNSTITPAQAISNISNELNSLRQSPEVGANKQNGIFVDKLSKYVSQMNEELTLTPAGLHQCNPPSRLEA